MASLHKRKYKQLVIVLITSLLIFSCSTSPTGRKQLILFSPQQMNAMGEQAFSAMKNDLKLSSTSVENEYVKCVTDALIPHIPAGAFEGQWEVVVFDDDQVNAFALPGGKIGVYTGLLAVAETDAQLAAVIGHEIGHVIAQHSNERMSQTQLINTSSQALNAVLAANEVKNNNLIMATIGLGLQVGVQLPYSRAHESESDVIGLVLMAKAGFDPRESVTLWENMAKAAGKKPPEILSTHPSEATRIEGLKRNMSAALRDFETASKKPNCSA